jgi:hypothetical protein
MSRLITLGAFVALMGCGSGGSGNGAAADGSTDQSLVGLEEVALTVVSEDSGSGSQLMGVAVVAAKSMAKEGSSEREQSDTDYHAAVKQADDDCAAAKAKADSDCAIAKAGMSSQLERDRADRERSRNHAKADSDCYSKKTKALKARESVHRDCSDREKSAAAIEQASAAAKVAETLARVKAAVAAAAAEKAAAAEASRVATIAKAKADAVATQTAVSAVAETKMDGDATIVSAAAETVAVAQNAASEVLIDKYPPEIVSFTLPTYSNSLTVPVTALTAKDDASGVVAFMVTKINSPPAANDPGWSTNPPTEIVANANTAMSVFYAWAKDATGKVSMGRLGIAYIDIKAPVVSFFMLPSTNVGTTVKISMLVTSDDLSGVYSYMITESATPPVANSENWSTLRPGACVVSSLGKKNLYMYAKDLIGNVSVGKMATVTVK